MSFQLASTASQSGRAPSAARASSAATKQKLLRLIVSLRGFIVRRRDLEAGPYVYHAGLVFSLTQFKDITTVHARICDGPDLSLAMAKRCLSQAFTAFTSRRLCANLSGPPKKDLRQLSAKGAAELIAWEMTLAIFQVVVDAAQTPWRRHYCPAVTCVPDGVYARRRVCIPVNCGSLAENVNLCQR